MDDPRAVFVDTGAFYARYVPRDDFHQESLALWKKVGDGRMECLTTNLVLSELITLFVYRFGSLKALQAAREIYSSGAIKIHRGTEQLELTALEWLERFPNQKFSMTDAVSFAVMHERKMTRAFTFDRHFEIAGFQRFR